MDGMSCLPTMNHMVKRGYHGWDILSTNNESRG